MTPQRFHELTRRYPSLHIGVVGDICLDRYFDIDPARAETSIETSLPVHNVVSVRCQPGAAGTILNNLATLGVQMSSVGLCGEDGEAWELHRALDRIGGRHHLISDPNLHTFTYSKPLLHRPGLPPEELNRLDLKNWAPTPSPVEHSILAAFHAVAPQLHALILMDQVDLANTGVITKRVREDLARFAATHPTVPVIADSRRGLQGWPPMIFKMNAAELATLTRGNPDADLTTIGAQAASLAQTNQHPVFVSLSERGILAASPNGHIEHAPSFPLRGPIDIVGAGDAVTANLACALASGATLREALLLAMAAASIVIHQLGTTGTANLTQIRDRLGLETNNQS